jgi:hypothetical protein
MIYELTRNVFVQQTAGKSQDALREVGLAGNRSIKLGHIVNFYNGTDGEKQTQQLTAGSIWQARQATRNVRLIAVVSHDQADAIPRGLKAALVSNAR